MKSTKSTNSIDASMQEIVDNAELDVETERRLELPLWIASAIFATSVTANLLQGPLWLTVLLSVTLGFVLGEAVGCRRRRRRALVRAARFRKHLGMEAAS